MAGCATRDPARFRELARRAADLLERDGDIDGALLQALDAGDRARAAALVGREAVRLGFDGRAGVLARRLAMLDARTFAEYPDAAVARAWLGVTTADAELIQRSLMLAVRADRGHRLCGRHTVGESRSGADQFAASARAGCAMWCVTPTSSARPGDHLVNPWWGAATVMKGTAEAMRG